MKILGAWVRVRINGKVVYMVSYDYCMCVCVCVCVRVLDWFIERESWLSVCVCVCDVGCRLSNLALGTLRCLCVGVCVCDCESMCYTHLPFFLLKFTISVLLVCS